MATDLRIGLIGYGEVGRILTAALRAQDLTWVGAWDVLFRARQEVGLTDR